MEKLKVGFIGLGGRGKGLMKSVLKRFDDVDVVAVCDEYEDRADGAVELIRQERGTEAAGYTKSDAFLSDKNVDIVIISAAWEAHVPLAVASIRAGKVTAL